MMKQRYLQWIHRTTNCQLDHQDFHMFLLTRLISLSTPAASAIGAIIQETKAPAKKRTSLLAAPSLVMTNSWAITDEGYKCVIKARYELGDQGYLEQRQKDTWIGKEVFIDRTTGKETGLHNFTRGQPQVLDRGSKEQSFKVFTIGQAESEFPMLQVIRVNEYSSLNNKPFMETSRTGIYTGTCENI